MMTEAAAGRRATARAEDSATEPNDAPWLGAVPRGDASETNELLRALLAVNGRLAFPEERLRALVSPTGASAYWLAYRMCDGRTSLTDIAKEVSVDVGNLSRAVAKWVDAGIAFRIGAKRFPLHLYPLAVEKVKARTAAKSEGSMELFKLLGERGRRKATPGVDGDATIVSGDGKSSEA